MTLDTSTARTLDGKVTAKAMREAVAKGCAELMDRHGIVPGLTVVLVGEDPASQIYVRNKNKTAIKAGMRSNVERLPATVTEEELFFSYRRATLRGEPDYGRGLSAIMIEG